MVIVFLFVILKVWLVLFVILDELEVVFDVVNVDCFVYYFDCFGDQGLQFIVIIYCKGIMMNVDVLYGVIM